MDTLWSLTRTQYVTTGTRNPIDETDRAGIHEVEVPEATIGIGSIYLQEIGEEGEREVGIIGEMIMRTAVADNNCKDTRCVVVEC